MQLNVRERPLVNYLLLLEKFHQMHRYRVKECKYAKDGKRWCYIFYPMGAKHVEGWVRAYYLAPLDISGHIIYIH